MNCTTTVEIGSYILGAVSPEDRARIQTHLIDCRVCELELINLASLPGLLAHVAPDDIPDAQPEPTGVESPKPVPPPTKRRIKRPRKRQRLLSIAASALAAAGTIIGLWITGSMGASHPVQHIIVLSGTDPSSGLRATARLTAKQWGTQVSLELGELPRNASCQLVVHARDGRKEVGGTWAATAYSGMADLPAATSIFLADISSLDVVTTDGRQLIDLARTAK
jgi:hypothetical protein